MINTGSSKWLTLLNSWRNEILDIAQSNREMWEKAGLPDLDELSLAPVDRDGVATLQANYGHFIDPEVAAFYQATDTWPLWLGSFWARLLPARSVNLFSSLYPDAFQIATESAPESRLGDGRLIELSRSELKQALVLTQPDAREFVLSLRSGETCFYYFDGMIVYDNFYEFMQNRRGEVKAWLIDMLSS